MFEHLLRPFRRAVRTAAEAGLYDALRMGSGHQELGVEQAAAAYRALHDPPPAGETRGSDRAADSPDVPPPPPAGPEPRRGPGRPPRKFQEPPQ